ncbi:hypothetical protein BY458DRAFT_495967 [Sporodiniella umbellata]|nr:hypothetical protein BY458DRAFT_495967 [Sporodiniella umbellata]
MDLDSLPPLARLPTNFFPSPRVHENQEPRTIVVAYDHSNYGDAMIAKAIHSDMLRPTDKIYLVYIIDQNDFRNFIEPFMLGYGTSTDDVADAHFKSFIDAFMWEIVTVLKKRGFDNVSSEILRGSPKEAVIDYCRAVKPSYLITGSRGLGSVKRAVMGSVSSFLVKHCPHPVLVVKLNTEEIEARKEMNKKKKDTFTEVLAKFDYPQPI